MEDGPVVLCVNLPQGIDYFVCRCNDVGVIVFLDENMTTEQQYKALLKALEEDKTKRKPF